MHARVFNLIVMHAYFLNNSNAYFFNLIKYIIIIMHAYLIIRLNNLIINEIIYLNLK